MRRILILCLLNTISASLCFAQDIPTPDSFLDFPLGTQFPYHHEVLDYVEALAEASPSVQLVSYGTTYERRPLVLAVVSSPENLQRIEEIRKNHIAYTGLLDDKPTQEDLAIVWLNFNIHGNEASGSNAAMAVLEALVNPEDPTIRAWLDKAIILIDPCVNPDGYARYVNWYSQKKSASANFNLSDWEHQEDWPGGRFNHYLFDLNRDWAWQTQKESQLRTAKYRAWMPHIHVDFHEMSHRSTYFFTPASPPFHQDLSPWQREFQEILSINHQKYFDKKKWLYFTGEVYDLFYPSYGDTWPMFNGAMGFTYEQAGGGRGGVRVLRSKYDTLTLKARINHHVTTALSTLETAVAQKDRLLKEFQNYFKENKESPQGPYKTYVIKAQGTSSQRLEALKQLLDRQQIRYGYPQGNGGNYSGFSYQKNARDNFSLSSEDLLISAYQANSRLLKVLFEPNPVLEDSLTYDLTAWALPYAFGLEAYACSERIPLETKLDKALKTPIPSESSYAVMIPWHDVKHARFLGALQEEEFVVRYIQEDIEMQGTKYTAGSMVILGADNLLLGPNWDRRAIALANEMKIPAYSIAGGKTDEGKDLGSRSSIVMQKPKVATLGGSKISPTSLGAIWHYFEQDLAYPLDIIPLDNLRGSTLKNYNVLILPPGSYTISDNLLSDFARGGGKIIGIEDGIRSLESLRNSRLSSASPKGKSPENSLRISSHSKNPDSLPRFEDRNRKRLNSRSAGAIYRVYLDSSHPLAFGLGEETYVLKLHDKVYPFLGEGAWNVGIYREDSHLGGYLGKDLKRKSINSLSIGHEYYGGGQLIYFVDPYLFRGFWHIGKLVMANAIFH